MKSVRHPRSRTIPRAAIILVAALGGILSCDSTAQTPTDPPASAEIRGIWISRDELRLLPTSGPAWDALVSRAHEPVSNPDLSDQDDTDNVRILAKALYSARTGDSRMAQEVVEACRAIRGTEDRATTLSIGRELMAYVLAADLVGFDERERQSFEAWLRGLQRRSFKGRTLRSTHEDRPNNWGTHAGATRLTIAAYLRDFQEIERAARVFRGWTGEVDGWHGFIFGADWWQSDPLRRFAVNPRNAMRKGHPIGGVLPDDQRRAGRFRWPPPRENYVYEALQGAVVQAALLERLGYDAWNWGDRALLRAFEWLHDQADYPAEGDDTWLPHVVNRAYGSRFPAPTPSNPGKGMGFTDWTHASRPGSSEASSNAKIIPESIPPVE